MKIKLSEIIEERGKKCENCRYCLPLYVPPIDKMPFCVLPDSSCLCMVLYEHGSGDPMYMEDDSKGCSGFANND